MMHHDQQSKVFCELCSLLTSLLRAPPLSSPRRNSSISSSSSSMVVCPPRGKDLSVAGFASLMLGMSLALMLCGSVTFVLGIFLFPWVLGLVMALYLCGLVSYLPWSSRVFFSGSSGSVKKDIAVCTQNRTV